MFLSSMVIARRRRSADDRIVRGRARLRRVLAGALLAQIVLWAGPAFAVLPGTVRVSVGGADEQGNGDSGSGSVSQDGRLVAFSSEADNLVPADTNGRADVFVRDVAARRTRRISVGRRGREANGASGGPVISANGQYVVFSSRASNLVARDTNRRWDVFVTQLSTGRIMRVSRSFEGGQANGDSYAAGISGTGQRVTFTSRATNLVSRDTNRATDVFVHDLGSRRTWRASVSSSEGQANADSIEAAISADGSAVAFASYASNLVSSDTNRSIDAFVREVEAGTTERVSVSSDGREANLDRVGVHASYDVDISRDGKRVAFPSFAANLVEGDTNGRRDVFVRDRAAGRTLLVSLSSTGEQGDGASEAPAISDDGLVVAFQSTATNLVPGDTNRETDIFTRDLVSPMTARVSVASDGREARGQPLSSRGLSFNPDISGAGTFVVFSSYADNLEARDANERLDVFRHGPLCWARPGLFCPAA